MDEIIYKDEAYKIVGAMMSVHNELGCGFLEAIYQEALEMEFQLQGIPYEREKELEVRYKGNVIGKKYKADFICYNKIIVELKAVDKILPEFKAQTLNYMKMSNSKLGILANFGQTSLEIQRLVRIQGW
ncbi:MAG: GxxExxY protein [Bacteroidales bacterium]|jgi:GxxExxY protein|nr:GxxExxY protein [Bacteroidales bacterium]